MSVPPHDPNSGDNGSGIAAFPEATLRDYFASQALNCLLMNPAVQTDIKAADTYLNNTLTNVCKQAYEAAGNMMSYRSRKH